MDVYGANGEKIGSINEVYDRYVMVEKGFFFPKDYYIPIDAIQGVDGDNRVFLTVSKDEALNQGWDTVPEVTSTGYGYTDQMSTRAGSSDSEVIAADYVAETDVAATGTDATRVPLYEEDLTATKRQVDRGKVRIEKELVTEDRTITVPVTEERVRVTRVDAADATSTANTADAFQDEVIEVPVKGEEVDVQKNARLAGEVVVEKEAVQKDKRVSGTVRREEVHVDDATVADAQTDSTMDTRNPMA
jgi:uncharacterized protein (TIGR02271 family)